MNTLIVHRKYPTTSTDFSIDIKSGVKTSSSSLSGGLSQFNGRWKWDWLEITEQRAAWPPPAPSGCFWHFPEGGVVWLWITWSINNSLVWCVLIKYQLNGIPDIFTILCQSINMVGILSNNAQWGADMWSPHCNWYRHHTLVVMVGASQPFVPHHGA